VRTADVGGVVEEEEEEEESSWNRNRREWRGASELGDTTRSRAPLRHKQNNRGLLVFDSSEGG
jgi:hypothetical protein